MTGLNTISEVELLIRDLQRQWLSVKLEDISEDDAAKKLKEDYLAEEQRNTTLKMEKDQVLKEIDEIRAERREKAANIKGEVGQLMEVTQKAYDSERRYGSTNPFTCAEKLSETCEAREAYLQDLYKQIEVAEKEDQDVKERLRDLQQKAPNAIPVIIKSKDEVYRSIDEAWRAERRKLNHNYAELTKKQRQLSWHLNRGSYIKQQPTDPRAAGQFGDKTGKVEVRDERLKIWEDKLVKEYLEWKDKAEDYRLQKIQVATEYENFRSGFEDRIYDGGKRGKPGSRPDMDDRISMMKTQLLRESKTCKDLVNENAELKSLKKQMEDEIKQQRRYSQQLLETQARNAMQLKLDEKKALMDKKPSVTRRQPLQIMEGTTSGKKRFEPRN